MSHRISPVLLSLVLASPVLAPAPSVHAQPAPPPDCAGETGWSDFDFWIGDWNVYTQDGAQFAGTNSITQAEGGCLIMEDWEGRGGGTGTSMNFYNPREDHWRQVWVSRGAVIDYTGGLNEAGQMVLEGEIMYQRRDLAAPFRGVWTPNGNGTVRQQFWQYNPETEEWAVWFDGLYVRQSEDTRQD